MPDGAGRPDGASGLAGRGRRLAEGVLAVAKDPGPTSHDVVAQVRRAIGQRRVGHCGTLDPLASGVLVLCLGRFTRLAELLSGEDKEYQAQLRLGATSDTYDADGTIQASAAELPAPTADAVGRAVAEFRGQRLQVPPSYSAVKVGGVRSHRLARQGRPVTLEARPVCIRSLNVAEYRYPLLGLVIGCSKGTYVRSLAHDLGQRLGCGAYVERLHRTRVGAVTMEDATAVEQVAAAAAAGALEGLLIPLERALPRMPVVRLGADQLRAFADGRAVCLDAPPPTGPCLVRDADGRFWGTGAVDPQTGWLRPHRVIAPAQMVADA